MSLSHQIEQQLRTAGAGPANVSARDGDDIVTCELVAIDSLGVSANRVELRAKRLTGLTTDQLREVADDLSRRVSYLLEAIAPIEIDDQACAIQMRSKPPHRAENATSYYELLVTAGAISLRRFNKAKGARREAESYDITRQVLLRLVDDFVAAASQA